MERLAGHSKDGGHQDKSAHPVWLQGVGALMIVRRRTGIVISFLAVVALFACVAVFWTSREEKQRTGHEPDKIIFYNLVLTGFQIFTYDMSQQTISYVDYTDRGLFVSAPHKIDGESQRAIARQVPHVLEVPSKPLYYTRGFMGGFGLLEVRGRGWATVFLSLNYEAGNWIENWPGKRRNANTALLNDLEETIARAANIPNPYHETVTEHSPPGIDPALDAERRLLDAQAILKQRVDDESRLGDIIRGRRKNNRFALESCNGWLSVIRGLKRKPG